MGGRMPKLSYRQGGTAWEMVTSGEKCATEVPRLFEVCPFTSSRFLAQHRLRSS